MTKRSILEKKKLQKDRLKLQREIAQHTKKWTFIFSSMLAVYALATVILLAAGLWYYTLGLIFGLCVLTWSLSEVKSNHQHRMKRLEEDKKIEDRIVNEIEKQEAWEEKLRENQKENPN